MKCLNPIKLHDKFGKLVEVPCGHCYQCKKTRAKEWAFRLMCEQLDHKSAIFITLTYAPEFITNVPYAPPPYYATLYPKDLTDFFKRLRFHLGERKFRYYACGEYGGETKRPHYHAILFDLDYCDTPLIEKSWSQGFVKVEEVNVATISYVAGYVQKKLYGSDTYPDCITPPFSRMSKSIGKKFFSEHCEDIWKNGLHFQGFRIKVPRYYYKLLLDKKIGDKKIYEVVEKQKENGMAAELDSELKLSRRFGYLDQSDDKEYFRLAQVRSQREYWDKKENLLKDRSKI